MRWIVPLALTTMILGGSAQQARAATPEQAIEIQTDVADLSESRANVGAVVQTELNRLLLEQESLPAGVTPADDRWVLVELRPGPIPGADDVLIRVEVQVDGAVIAESATETCLACTDEQVAEKALELVEPLLPKLPAPAPAEPPAPEVVEPSQDDAGTRSRSKSKARLDPKLLIPGATLLGVGVVGIGVGIGLIVVNERVVSEPGAANIDLVEYRGPGIAVACVSGAVAVTGAALLGLAFGRSRRQADVAIVPSLGPAHAGISITRRF